ncbi:hypothetical protein LTR37_015014 [Vermiconidia calcicola]|uniref:Uncharacterized protein n=1 Tax=Vermiconidia calcicola TaxID=1690605 RepID=A0ACC3MRU2_9PEZI|nr:hypothetical protein LTR37_015014 [Vermiconidia calcicola]
MRRCQLVLAILAATVSSHAAKQHLAKQCFKGGVCYQLNIPAETASSGEGHIYFQISGPTSYSWIGLGQGSQMAGSNIFVIYSDGSGNVTLSARRGEGHFEPEHDTSANVSLLEGSGISNGRMVANVLCRNCQQWQGGRADFTSMQGAWIHASRPGRSLRTMERDANLEQHEDNGAFVWDYGSAKGGGNVNPFVSRGEEPIVSTPPPDPAESDAEIVADTKVVSDALMTAHGTLAAITFLVLLPVGAMILRVPGIDIWIHAGIQIFNYCCFIAAAGLGIYMAIQERLSNHHHPLIGMVLLGVLFFQPVFGYLHHRAYKSTQRRTLVSYIHVWVGRLAILLGMINGGLGIQLAGDVRRGYLVAYSVVAAIMGIVFLCSVVYWELSARKSSQSTEQGGGKSTSW